MPHHRAFLAFLAAAALSLAASAGAQNNCDGNLTDFDAVYCYQKLFVKADADLNAVYTKLLAALPESGRATLRARQREWIRRRDAESVLTRDGFKYVSVDRATDMTVARTNELGDRLRECVSSGCRLSLLR
ncbi:lysozyme inhibitor LprI family protein [Deinococcus pimensis]|uniref:lysozyme inhibitor LprI family protein n=1 Tax=Deinococcus pimensis TaxID=309888 RepID=UPI000480679A|nr:lysozyme inhibitor LprI family protein [Deinococcus pimensis]